MASDWPGRSSCSLGEWTHFARWVVFRQALRVFLDEGLSVTFFAATWRVYAWLRALPWVVFLVDFAFDLLGMFLRSVNGGLRNGSP